MNATIDTSHKQTNKRQTNKQKTDKQSNKHGRQRMPPLTRLIKGTAQLSDTVWKFLFR